MNNETFVWSEGLLQIIKKGVEHEKSKYLERIKSKWKLD